jgi:hypothetical protein
MSKSVSFPFTTPKINDIRRAVHTDFQLFSVAMILLDRKQVQKMHI